MKNIVRICSIPIKVNKAKEKKASKRESESKWQMQRLRHTLIWKTIWLKVLMNAQCKSIPVSAASNLIEHLINSTFKRVILAGRSKDHQDLTLKMLCTLKQTALVRLTLVWIRAWATNHNALKVLIKRNLSNLQMIPKKMLTSGFLRISNKYNPTITHSAIEPEMK